MKRIFKYLKAAFFVREKIPLLGAVPVNLLAVFFFIALGFGHPAFWLLGLIGETVFLWMMAGSRRFRHLVDAIELQEGSERAKATKAELTGKLLLDNSMRYQKLVQKLEFVKSSYQQFGQDEFMAGENLANLRTLESVFLRLLIAKQHLTSPDTEADEARVRQRIAELQEEISAGSSEHSESAIESRRQTLELLEKRLQVFDKRSQAIDEIESDLEQIEAQFQLAADGATISAKPSEAQLDMDLARSMIVSTPEYLILGDDVRPDVVAEPGEHGWEVE